MGGLLALDLAHKHADDFRAVISLEGALRFRVSSNTTRNCGTPGQQRVQGETHGRTDVPNLSQASKGNRLRVLLRLATVFLGDLNYYLEDYDLTASTGDRHRSRRSTHPSAEWRRSGTAVWGERLMRPSQALRFRK